MSLYTPGAPFTPEPGTAYRNINGITYTCVAAPDPDDGFQPGCAWMVSPAGWLFKAMRCRRYQDGSIDWGHSLYGHFIDRETKQISGG